jgi:hypothetical protein
MYIGLGVKFPLFLPDFNESWIFCTDLRKKYSNIKFYENQSSGRRVVSCKEAGGRTDRQTDVTKLTAAFPNLAKAPKIFHSYISSFTV